MPTDKMPMDKMPKHVEMVRTKSKPKNGTNKMPTTKKVRTKCQPLLATKLGLFIWQNPLDSKTQRGFHCKTHGTIQGSIIWQNPLDSKTHRGYHGKTHGTIQGSQSYGKTHSMGKAIGESMVK